MSLKDAAAELHVTPGAVSRQIRALENNLGVTLFTRVHRGVELTQAGMECYGVLARTLGETANVLRSIRTSARPVSVTIAATTAFAAMWLMPRIVHFWREHPGIMINHFISETPADFGRSEFDLRIRYGSGAWPGEVGLRLFGDRIFPVCSPAFAKQHGALTAASLLGAALLKLEGVNWEWTNWEDFLRRVGVVVSGPLPGRRFNNYVIAIQAAVDGQGVALGWESLVSGHIEKGTLQRLTDAVIDAPEAFYVTWPSHPPLKAEASVLRDWLVAVSAISAQRSSVELR
jgi:LysR family transcriptional regulator, glycine cleavage system transcriptional activator